MNNGKLIRQYSPESLIGNLIIEVRSTMENEEAIRGTNEGAASATLQPKIVAEMPQDNELKSPEEAAENDGFPGSCQF